MPSNSLTNVPRTSMSSFDALFDELRFTERRDLEKFDKRIETNHDLLVLSSTWYRMRNERDLGKIASVPFSKLTDINLPKYVIQADHENAARIRDYYSKKIMMWNLLGTPLSQYRQDLSFFIHGDQSLLTEKICPLVFRLPEFYDYDIEVDHLFNLYNRKITGPKFQYGIKNLTLARSFIVGKKFGRRKEYWFTDSENNLVSFSIPKDNQLIPLLDMYVRGPIAISAEYNQKYRNQHEYLIATKLKFC